MGRHVAPPPQRKKPATSRASPSYTIRSHDRITHETNRNRSKHENDNRNTTTTITAHIHARDRRRRRRPCDRTIDRISTSAEVKEESHSTKDSRPPNPHTN